jgi:hypothetical protein
MLLLVAPFAESAMAAPVSIDAILQKNAFALARGSLPLLGADLGDEAIVALARRGDVPLVREVGLARNRIGPTGLAALLEATWLPEPRSLDLQSNPGLGEAGFRALGASSRARSLTALWLAGSGGTAAGYAQLVGPGNLAALERFQGGLDQAGDVGALALLGLQKLRFLVLKEAGVGPVGARALLSHPTLESLDISGNAFGGALSGLTALAPAIESLTARGCGLGALDLAALARADVHQLRMLDISDNPAGDDGARAITGAPWLGQLTSLTWMRSGASKPALAHLRAAWGARAGLAVGP